MNIRVEYVVDEATLSLRSESFIEDGRGAAVHTLRWDTLEEMRAGLEAGKQIAREYLTEIGEKAQKQVYAGETAAGATSYIKRFSLPFQRLLAVGWFTGHEYDEARLVAGPVQVTVSVKLTGGFYWDTLKVARNGTPEMLFGVGGASSACFVFLTRSDLPSTI